MIIKDRNTLNKKSYSGTSGLGMLEHICLIVLPILIGWIIFMMFGFTTELVLWLRIIITILIWSLLMGVIWLFSWYASENDWR